MLKLRGILYCLLTIAAIGGLIWLLFPRGEVMARSEMKDERGFSYNLKVTSFGERCRMELVFNHKFVVSIYEFYAGSVPPKSATITWPELHKFTVTFDTGDIIHGSWDDYKFYWDNGNHPTNH